MLDLDQSAAGDDEVLVEVAAVRICDSEFEGFANQSPTRVPPLSMGHEFAGIRLDKGWSVVVNPVVSCRRCDLCLRGLTNICRQLQILGIRKAGRCANRVAVPEVNCYTLASYSPFAIAAVVEPVANATHAFRPS